MGYLPEVIYAGDNSGCQEVNVYGRITDYSRFVVNTMRNPSSKTFNEIELEAKDGVTGTIDDYGVNVKQSTESVFMFSAVGLNARIARIVGYR